MGATRRTILPTLFAAALLGPFAFIPSIKSRRVAVMAYSNSPPGRRSSLWREHLGSAG